MESSRKDGEPGVISHEGNLRNCLVRAHEKTWETHTLVSQLKLLDDRVLRDGRPSKIVPDVYECWKRASDERLYTLESYCWGVGVSVEEERIAWLLGCQFSRNGQYIVMVRRMRFGWVRGEKVEAERVDDEEDGAFVGRF